MMLPKKTLIIIVGSTIAGVVVVAIIIGLAVGLSGGSSSGNEQVTLKPITTTEATTVAAKVTTTSANVSVTMVSTKQHGEGSTTVIFLLVF